MAEGNYENGFRAGLRRAEEIATQTTDHFWDTEFAHHGNSGLAKMKQKVGFEIEDAIHAAWKAAANVEAARVHAFHFPTPAVRPALARPPGESRHAGDGHAVLAVLPPSSFDARALYT